MLLIPVKTQIVIYPQGKDAENSIDAPEHVVPVASSASVGSDGRLRVEMPAWSVMVVRVPLAAAEPELER